MMLLSALALVACGDDSVEHPATREGTVTADAVACRLSVRQVGGQGSLQHRYPIFAVSTRSSTACVVRGFPRLTLLDEHIAPLPTHPRRVNGLLGYRQARTTIRAGHPARFALEYAFHDAAGRRLCKPVASAIRIMLPGNRRASIVRIGPDASALLNPCRGRFNVSPIARTRDHETSYEASRRAPAEASGLSGGARSERNR